MVVRVRLDGLQIFRARGRWYVYFRGEKAPLVRGFDGTANRYKYEINPRFGSANPQFNAFRAPVTLTIEQGFITDIRGGLDAELLSSYIQVHSTTTAATECRT